MDWSISLAQLIKLPVATIGVSKKGHASQLRSQQNERVMPSCTLFWIHCQVETELWMFTSWGDVGRNFWAPLTPLHVHSH